MSILPANDARTNPPERISLSGGCFCQVSSIPGQIEMGAVFRFMNSSALREYPAMVYPPARMGAPEFVFLLLSDCAV